MDALQVAGTGSAAAGAELTAISVEEVSSATVARQNKDLIRITGFYGRGQTYRLRGVDLVHQTPEDWTPRELRHSFVSLLSEHGVAVEEIARLVGHAGGSKVTEQVYRHELRPVIQTGATAMDELFTGTDGAGHG